MIEIDAADEATGRLWSTVADLCELLPEDWVLVGGLMVQLHALEHGSRDVRLTSDIDVLGQARPPGAIPTIDKALRTDGFTPEEPDGDGYAFRYVREDVIVDLLAPDGITPPPQLGGGLKAIGIPGGSQALQRAEEVTVSVKGRQFALRRPTLLGAILIKARSLKVHADPATQREDLLRLLALLPDPRDAATDLRKSERKWLRTAEDRLSFATMTTLNRDDVRQAELAYRLLVREPD